MSGDHVYRCTNCLAHTVTRNFAVPELSVLCPVCDSFEQMINDAVYDQFQAFEASPPDDLDWDRLARGEKIMVSKKVVLEGHSIDDFSIEDGTQ